MNSRRDGSPVEEIERFALPAAKQRWLDFAALEHATLASPIDFAREGDSFLVRRARREGRSISAGRIPKDHGAALFLQAAAACAFLQAHGFWLDEEDLASAVWDVADGSARLWLTRSPAALRRGGPGPAPCAVLAAFLDRLFARGRKLAHPAARGLLENLLAADAPYRRAEFWLSSAFRVFPELASARSAPARRRTLGTGGQYCRSAPERALFEKVRALLCNREPRVFSMNPFGVAGGEALGLTPAPASLAAAVRALKERHARERGGRAATWIAVEPERWDSLSRRAFQAAALSLSGEVETLDIPAAAAPAALPDEWRREIFVPCGTLQASLRFYERFAALVQEDSRPPRLLAEAMLSSADWAVFAADATGDAPLPAPALSAVAAGASDDFGAGETELLEALAALGTCAPASRLSRLCGRRSVLRLLAGLEKRGHVAREPSGMWGLSPSGRRQVRLSPSRAQEICRRWAREEKDPERRIVLWLEGEETERALEEARESILPCRPRVEKWFGLSARLCAALPEKRPCWLEALEAERDVAGGRLAEATERLVRVAQSPVATAAERREAALRGAEIRAMRGEKGAAARLAGAWRESFPDAPAGERSRALRLEAAGRSREGSAEEALALLDEAERAASELTTAERIEIALVRAGVYSLAGRFREEEETYNRWRAEALWLKDDLLAARFLASEALGFSDRREFARAVALLEQALAVARDDPVEHAWLSIDLAATLYHAGRPDRCGALLDEAIALAACAGRDDLLRLARGNRLELSINACRFEEASREVESLLETARQEADASKILVALHHRSRLALRRGFLDEAARDNEEARRLALELSDRLETGELLLEEGDRLLYAGNRDGARRAYEAAALDPPDRCDSEARARERLIELDGAGSGQLPVATSARLNELFARDEYAAAEMAARWRVLLGPARQDPATAELFLRAERVLRGRGGAALADRVFGPANAVRESPGSDALRALRALVSRALGGDCAGEIPAECGFRSLRIADRSGNSIVRVGAESPEGGGTRRVLDAGAATYEALLWPEAAAETADSVFLMLETLLYRSSPLPPPSDFSEGWRRLGVVASDASMEEPYRRLVRFAPQPVTVLVLGESGCGKEAVARAVHSLSPRASGPFVAVNISAIPPALLESELFGHARGAFTGADRDRMGLLEEAARGTIFFDEVGDLTLPLQAKLLRALQEREIRRVGENRARKVDVRVVSATSRDLAREVEAGRFREDLYYRLHVAVITLPSLKERGRDVAILARHFFDRYAREYGRGELKLAPDALAALTAHSWPGNVRELQNVVAQAAALADVNGLVSPSHLPEGLRRERRPTGPPENYRSQVDAHRRGLIREALELAGGNRSRAARELGLSRQALLYLIRELNVTPRTRPSH